MDEGPENSRDIRGSSAPQMMDVVPNRWGRTHELLKDILGLKAE
jgi:hypothetical protein